METLRARLAADPLAVAPDEVLLASPLMQTMSALGANGISQMSILLYMDAGLPIGTVPQADGRKFPQLAEDITTITNDLKPYPAFRGWSWVANWWVWNNDSRYANPEEKTAYDAALTKAKETGEWSEVLETVGNRRFSFGVDAERNFHEVLDKVAPGKIARNRGHIAASTRNPPLFSLAPTKLICTTRPSKFRGPPRPGTPWTSRSGRASPRGAILSSGTISAPANRFFPIFSAWQCAARMASASRARSRIGAASPKTRAAHTRGHFGFSRDVQLFHQYGPWLQSLQPNDHVAIVVSGRMAKIDQWNTIGGEYFTRLFEAYQSCLYAHRPASFVFAEDLKPDTLQKYQAVLVVGQTVDMEPPLAAALKSVKSKVHYDGTCRESLVKDYSPLGVIFDKVTHDPSAWQDDAAYPRFAAYFMDNAKALSKTLSAALPPAQTTEAQVLLTERVAENGRYVWVLNSICQMLKWASYGMFPYLSRREFRLRRRSK